MNASPPIVTTPRPAEQGNQDTEDGFLVFLGEGRDEGSDLGEPHWTVLAVDDDPDVHAVTALSLSEMRILGRPLELLHANSAREAEGLLRERPDIAVALIDVVMESPDAGLKLVRTVREQLGNYRIRLILRTGQPGYAPEQAAVRDYDINDYRTKGELTHVRLFTALTSALRSYTQIEALERNDLRLRHVVESHARIVSERSPEGSLGEAIRALAPLVEPCGNGLACEVLGGPVATGFPDGVIRAAAGELAGWTGRPLADLEGSPLGALMLRCLAARALVVDPHGVAAYLRQGDAPPVVLLLSGQPASRPVADAIDEVLVHSTDLGCSQVRMLSRLRDAAYVDPLLGLPSRNALIEAVEDWIRDAEASLGLLLVVDVDGFSELNETFGGEFGDRLLGALAERLKSGARARAMIARIANDTFGLLGPADSLDPGLPLALFSDPLAVGDMEIAVSVSCGAVVLDQDVGSGAEALRFGYSALKLARVGGPRRTATYSPTMATEIRERTRLLQGLRRAFDQRNLYLAFQPQIDAASGAPFGMEALMRWRTEQGMLIPPDRFVPLAEHSGLIRQLGAWALRMALHTLRDLDASGWPGLRMAVNVSVAQLMDPDFERLVAGALEESGCAAGRLEIEITESVAMQSADLVVHKLQALREMGVLVAIDDFGTGFSSLSYLERFAVDRLKIDRSFVMAIDESGNGARIAEAVIELGRSLGLRVIAEGVETQTQCDRLRQLGCHELQGYLFSPPLTVEQLKRWFEARSA